MKKLLYVVLDGLGDLPTPELDGKTPLEAAKTPNLDFLAKKGKTGLMYSVGKGIAPESDVAVISILGYDPFKYHPSRGVIEAVGAGLDFRDGDLALRCNFATVDEEGFIVDRRVGRSLTTEEASRLAETINREVKLTYKPSKFIFKNTIGHRAVLVVRLIDGKLSGKITNVDPAYLRTMEGLGVAKAYVKAKVEKSRPLNGGEEAKIAAELLNEFIEKSHRILKNHELNLKRVREGKLPANFILARDAGDTLPKFPSFQELYKVRFGCMADMPVERGIALLCGMEEIPLPQLTGDLRKDYSLRVEKTLEALEKLDGVYIHIKGPDEPGHDGDAIRKMRVIELIDEFYFAKLLPKLDLEKVLVVVTADHSTPCIVRSHTDDPVPLLISGGGVEADSVDTFSEKACRMGSLGTIKGSELMPTLIKLLRG